LGVFSVLFRLSPSTFIKVIFGMVILVMGGTHCALFRFVLGDPSFIVVTQVLSRQALPCLVCDRQVVVVVCTLRGVGDVVA